MGEKKPLTREFLVNRGWCCGTKCQNCPYVPKWKKYSTAIEDD